MTDTTAHGNARSLTQQVSQGSNLQPHGSWSDLFPLPQDGNPETCKVYCLFRVFSTPSPSRFSFMFYFLATPTGSKWKFFLRQRWNLHHTGATRATAVRKQEP